MTSPGHRRDLGYEVRFGGAPVPALSRIEEIRARKKIRIQTLGSRLLNHQLWFFGRDILYPEGNLLIRYGFERYKCPEMLNRGNMYRLTGPDGSQVVLWGFGVCFGGANGDGVFIRRYDFRPVYLTLKKMKWPIWTEDDITSLGKAKNGPEGHTLLIGLIDWFESYEAWVVERTGRVWRNDCIKDWPNSAMTYRAFCRGLKKLHSELEEI
jgi:hypothetical protein